MYNVGFIKWLEYIILGIVQGVGEIFPISSSGHILFVRQIFGVELNDLTLEVFLHLASLLAIILFFYKKILVIIRDFFLYLIGLIFNKGIMRTAEEDAKGEQNTDKVGAQCAKIVSSNDSNVIITRRRNFYWGLYIIIATIPAGILGLLFDNIIETKLTDIILVGIMLIVTGIILFITGASKGTKEINEIKWWQAGIIGLFQGFGLIPGISRSGSVLAGATSNKVKQVEASEFAFLLAIPIILGSSIFKIGDIGVLFKTQEMIPVYLTSFAIAFVLTLLSLKFFFFLVKKQKLSIFATYCLIAGSVFIVAKLTILK
jgi:undecaprenyl-diphosphatase